MPDDLLRTDLVPDDLLRTDVVPDLREPHEDPTA